MNIIKAYQTVFTDCQRSWGKVMLSQVSVILLGRGSRVSLVPGHFLAPGTMSFPKEGRLSLAPDHFLGIYQWRIYVVVFGKIVCWRPPSPPPESWSPLLGEILDPPLYTHGVRVFRG